MFVYNYFCSMIIVAILAIVIYFSNIFFHGCCNSICKSDYSLGGKVSCKASCISGRFAIHDMQDCYPWLNCYDVVNDVHRNNDFLLLRSVVKTVYISKWKNKEIIISELSTKEFQSDFKEHLKNLILFSPNPHIVQLVGFCDNIIVTEYHKLGNALNFKLLILNEDFKLYDNMSTRLRLCRDYASILSFLHRSDQGGPRIMCDSSSLEKTLTQYLLTDELGLVVADLDAVPVVGKNGTKCGHRPLMGDFVAPEQKWPFSDIPFNDSLMPSYDEKSDIWKVPDVCNWFLGDSRESDIVKFRLYPLHNSCKNVDPRSRPTAEDILREYQTILDEFMEL